MARSSSAPRSASAAPVGYPRPLVQPLVVLAGLPLGDLPDGADVQAEPAYDVLVEHDHTAAGDRPHGEPLAAGRTELAHQEHIERVAPGGRHLVRHRHAAARQARTT
ncbi:hypothetical protein [Microbispora sp. H11081]|uniref:hypothetical protein n=1 Tax=Microbispora sp. H11081 TaxID=2729107 RepID=UPI001473446E|nr:hypothetical protein [Microbispora sp. H11081]